MRRRTVGLWVLVVVCLVVHAGSQPASADNWPRFRGPNGTGIVSDKEVPIQWNEKEGILWKVPLPGNGNSCPIVWGNRLFLQTADPEGKERSLLCVSVTDGKILWSRSVPGAKAKIHQFSSLASSTPATTHSWTRFATCGRPH